MTAGGARRRQLETLLEPCLPRLYRLACRLTGSRVDAEDLFQDVLVTACTRLDEIAGLDKPVNWLARVMYNRFVDDRRRLGRRRLTVVGEGELPGAGLAALSDTGDDLHDYVWREQLHLLERALAELGEGQRIVLLMHDAEGYTLKEIAEITGEPVGTQKSRLHRARRRLRAILPEDGTLS